MWGSGLVTFGAGEELRGACKQLMQIGGSEGRYYSFELFRWFRRRLGLRCARCGTPWQRLIRVRHWGCRCLRRRWEGQLARIGLPLEVRSALSRNKFTQELLIWGLNVNLVPELGHPQVDLIWALTRGWLSLSGCGSNCVLIASPVPSLHCHGRDCRKQSHLYQFAGSAFLSFSGRKTKAFRRTSV